MVPPLGPRNIGRYVAGQDTPKYGDNLGPHCYSIPFRGITLNDGAAPSNPAATSIPAGTPRKAGRQAAGPQATRRRPRSLAPPRERAGQGTDRDGAAPFPRPGTRLGQPATAPLFRGTTVTLRTPA